MEHLPADKTKPVYLNEGEKAADAINEIGGAAVATGGAKRPCDLQPLTGRHVNLIADRDTAGDTWAERLVAELEGIALSIKVMHSAVETEKADAADHIAAGYGLDEFVEVQQPETAAPDNEVIDGAALLDELHGQYVKFVVFPSTHEPVVVTLWTAATHAISAWQHATRLAIDSPQKRCGKTRLLDIIGETSHSPLMTSNATTAAIFRVIAKHGDSPPTIVLDEADALFGTKTKADQNEDLRALFNNGFARGKPTWRCVGPTQEPTPFSNFAMAALAGIGKLPDTITDRAISIALQRRSPTEEVAKFRQRRNGPKLNSIRDRLAAWVQANITELEKAEPVMPVDDREADAWEPLFAIAELAGGKWPARVKLACLELCGSTADDDADLGTLLLHDIRNIFAVAQVPTGWAGTPFLASQALVNELRNIEESPWKDKELNTSGLAAKLKPYGVRPDHNAAKTVRGYMLESFRDAFRRYLRPDPSSRPEDDADQGEQARTAKTATRPEAVQGVQDLDPTCDDTLAPLDNCRSGRSSGHPGHPVDDLAKSENRPNMQVRAILRTTGRVRTPLPPETVHRTPTSTVCVATVRRFPTRRDAPAARTVTAPGK